ncbi:UDP-N-acetylglucosamine--dolichyl-phosphate N-acetylglucosaminyltransferase [uncultured archaeon]|nr:UDP-N-acetylglucosamine--dolichyl-phosphate N-acetylglucosaminyltransferase [uncultured archaeon]
MKLVITIPAYNEQGTISRVIAEIPEKIAGVDSTEVLVIDDGSTDSTGKEAKKAGAKVIRNMENCGLAFTFSRGMKTALEIGADIIVNTDADFQYNQKQIPALVKPIIEGNADIVLGSRFAGSIEFMPLQNRLGNLSVSFIMRTITGLPLTDTQTGFRAFSREAALRINVFSDYTYTQETILEAHEKRLRVTEVPVDFRKREGKSRLISNVFSYARRVGLTIMVAYLNYRPLRVFFSLGLLLCIAGFAFGFRVLVHFLNTGMVSPYIPSALVSALLLILGFEAMVMGLLAELIKRNRKVQEEALYFQKKAFFDKKG